MYIKELSLNNFRNYENASIYFSDGINIFYGDNAQGKTNILEAIYMSSTTKSHRGSKDKEIIRFGQEEAHIKLDIKKDETLDRIDIHLKSKGKKGYAFNMIPLKKSSDLFGILNVVIFSTEDLSIVKEGPAFRRRFMDMELCQLSKVYYHNLLNYNKILDQRNNFLKNLEFGPLSEENKIMLDVWDNQLGTAAIEIIKEREKFVNRMNEIIDGIHSKLTEGKETLKIKYEKNVAASDLFMQLAMSRDSDIRQQTTHVGPHRDDLSFTIEGVDARKFGSQGQQRTVALSLKLAEIEIVKEIIKDNPILLLDDVMSELDSKRRDALLDYISTIQTIITCTGYDDFIKERISIDKIYKVTEGVLREEKNE